MYFKTFSTNILVLLLCACSWAQEVSMEVADRFSSDSLYPLVRNFSITPNWIGDKNDSFYYSLDENGDETFYLFNSKKSKKFRLFSLKEVVNQIDQSSEDSSKIYKLDFNKEDISYCDFKYKKNHYRFFLNTRKFEKLPPKQVAGDTSSSFSFGTDYYSSYSKDSLYHISTYDHNLYLFKKGSKDSLQLTYDGVQYHSYALGGNKVKSKHLKRAKPIGKWVGNHTFFLIREDERLVDTMTLVNNLKKPYPVAKTYKFPMPGAKNVVQYEAYMVRADEGKISSLSIQKYKDQKIETPPFSNYIQTKESVYFIRRPRTNDRVELCKVDIESGKVVTLLSEDCSPRLNEQLFNYKVLNEGKEIIWWSERTGRGSYYLYDGNGKLKNRITPDKFVAGKMVRLDSINRNIIVEGYGGNPKINPHYRMFYKSSFDKEDAVLLTPDNGDHSIQLSLDGKFLVDSYSRMDLAPIHQLRNAKGKWVANLGECDLSQLYAKGWKMPKVEQFMATDSITKLYGVVYFPFDMDPNKKYPIISNVYPGPHTDLLPQSFSLDDNYNQSLAQLGFIVMNVAYRGSGPYRGKEFYIYGQNNLRDYALDDDKAVIEQLAKKYPFADIERVGIYGHSGGGFMAATAMLSHPDFYKVGVAASGNYDNNIYTQWWGETFHGVTEKKDKNNQIYFECKIPTTMELAQNLKGRLLLITGDMDINVHPANTIRLANALIRANKRFDMMIIPGADHGLGDKYFVNLLRYYFVEHLLHYEKEDIDIINHK